MFPNLLTYAYVQNYILSFLQEKDYMKFHLMVSKGTRFDGNNDWELDLMELMIGFINAN